MEWISTKDRLPEHNQEILLVTYDEEYQCPDDAPEWWQDEDGKPLHLEEHIGVWYGRFSDYRDPEGKGKFYFTWENDWGGESAQSKIDMIEESGQPCHITHWMPMPQPPSKAEIERVAKQ